jgi:hypothetical protein
LHRFEPRVTFVIIGVRTLIPAAAAILALVLSGQVSAASGTQLWVASDGDASIAPPTRLGRIAAVAPDGSAVYRSGIRWNGETFDFMTIAYDATTGEKIWESDFDSGCHEEAFSLALAPDGTRVFVTGWSACNTTSEWITLAYDAATGAKLWIRRYSGDPEGDNEPLTVAASSEGSRVYVAGHSSLTRTPVGDATIVAYDAATGARLWIRRYDGPDHADDAAVDLALNAVASRLFVAAASCEPSPGVVCHSVTLAYDAVTGTRLWVRRLDVDSEPAKLAVSPDGARIFVTGDRFSTNSADYKTIAYSATDGSTLWSRTYDGPAHGQDDAFDVAPNPDGSAVIVTGQSLGANGRFDYTTIAYRATVGRRVWMRRYDPGQGFDSAFALVLSPDGRTAYVSGESGGFGTGSDIATVAYNTATGDKRWNARYATRLSDVGFDIAVGPGGGKVFVAGSSRSHSAMVAYSTH